MPHNAPTCSLRQVGAALLALAAFAQHAPTQVPERADALERSSSTTLQLTLAGARRLAERQNPDYRAARQLPAVARGALRQASAIRFNPDLAMQGGNDRQVVLTEEIEWAGQRRVRVSAARHGLARAEFDASDAGRQALADASIAYYRVLAATGKRRVVEQLLASTERLITAVRVQLKEGEISVLDANLAEIENGRARARAFGSRRELVGSELELKRLLGVMPAVSLNLADDSSVIAVGILHEDSLVTLALRRRPDVASARAASGEARSLTTLARRDAFPNVRVGGVFEPARPGGVGIALGLSLPLFNRNGGAIEAAEAGTRRADLLQAALEARVRAEVVGALESYRAASNEVLVYTETVLERARANAALLEEAYQAGKTSLTSLLLLRNQLLDAEYGYWEAWLARQEALVRLDSATGALLPSPETGATSSAPENP